MLHSLGFDNTDISLLESDLVICVRIDSFKASDRLINMFIIKTVVQHFNQLYIFFIAMHGIKVSAKVTLLYRFKKQTVCLIVETVNRYNPT